MFDFIITLVESIFFISPLIIIKEIKSKKIILMLYLSIILISFSISSILGNSIFKYIAFPILIYIYLRFLIKETSFYDFFVIIIEQILKTIIEDFNNTDLMKYLKHQDDIMNKIIEQNKQIITLLKEGGTNGH